MGVFKYLIILCKQTMEVPNAQAAHYLGLPVDKHVEGAELVVHAGVGFLH
jgi:hypothetical protein